MKRFILILACLALAGSAFPLWTTQYPADIWNVQTFFKQCDKGTAPLNTSALSINGTEVINSSGVYTGAMSGGAGTFSEVNVSSATGVKITGDGDGAITFLGMGNGSDEDMTWNLDDISNVCTVSSSTSMATINFSSIALQESGVGVVNLDEIDASSELAAIMDDETGTGALVFAGSPFITGTPTLSNSTASSGKIAFYEDFDNGTNTVTVAGPASTADATVTLPAIDGGTVALLNVDNGASTFRVDSVTADTYVYGASVSAIASRLNAASNSTGTVTNETGQLATQLYKVTVPKAAFTAAGVTQTLTIATLPAKSIVHSVFADVTEAFSCTGVCTSGTLSAKVGVTGTIDMFLLEFDLDAATDTFGIADGEMGAGLSVAAEFNGGYNSWSSVAVLLTAVSGTGNWGDGASATNLATGSVTVYILASVLP